MRIIFLLFSIFLLFENTLSGSWIEFTLGLDVTDTSKWISGVTVESPTSGEEQQLWLTQKYLVVSSYETNIGSIGNYALPSWVGEVVTGLPLGFADNNGNVMLMLLVNSSNCVTYLEMDFQEDVNLVSSYCFSSSIPQFTQTSSTNEYVSAADHIVISSVTHFAIIPRGSSEPTTVVDISVHNSTFPVSTLNGTSYYQGDLFLIRSGAKQDPSQIVYFDTGNILDIKFNHITYLPSISQNMFLHQSSLFWQQLKFEGPVTEALFYSWDLTSHSFKNGTMTFFNPNTQWGAGHALSTIQNVNAATLTAGVKDQLGFIVTGTYLNVGTSYTFVDTKQITDSYIPELGLAIAPPSGDFASIMANKNANGHNQLIALEHFTSSMEVNHQINLNK